MVGKLGKSKGPRAELSTLWLSCAELLYGGKIGVYQYNTALNITTRTADGVVSWPSLSTILLSLQQRSAPQPAAGAF